MVTDSYKKFKLLLQKRNATKEFLFTNYIHLLIDVINENMLINKHIHTRFNK